MEGSPFFPVLPRSEVPICETGISLRHMGNFPYKHNYPGGSPNWVNVLFMQIYCCK